ncbi:hypothetical protein Taro_038093, partial [Colocasia esculenta]|nr:hypothetical protein [Colocasia esculenta]
LHASPRPLRGCSPVPPGHGLLSSLHFTHGGHISPPVTFAFDYSSFYSGWRIPEEGEEEEKDYFGQRGKGRGSRWYSSQSRPPFYLAHKNGTATPMNNYATTLQCDCGLIIPLSNPTSNQVFKENDQEFLRVNLIH